MTKPAESWYPEQCLIRYERQQDMLRLTLWGVTNHELREMICGLWARLDADDRRDHIDMLKHYAEVLDENEPGRLSVLANALRTADEGNQAINLREVPIPED